MYYMSILLHIQLNVSGKSSCKSRLMHKSSNTEVQKFLYTMNIFKKLLLNFRKFIQMKSISYSDMEISSFRLSIVNMMLLRTT